MALEETWPMARALLLPVPLTKRKSMWQVCFYYKNYGGISSDQTTSLDIIQIRPLFMLHDPFIGFHWFSCQLFNDEFRPVERLWCSWDLGDFLWRLNCSELGVKYSKLHYTDWVIDLNSFNPDDSCCSAVFICLVNESVQRAVLSAFELCVGSEPMPHP